MIPRWIYSLMVKNRINCVMERDEHGRSIEEPPYRPIGLASPGYSDGKEDFASTEEGLAKKVDGGKIFDGK